MNVHAGVSLREYRAADLDAMFALDQVCFAAAFRFSRRAMRGFAEAHGAIGRIAVGDGGELAGFVIVQLERRGERVFGYVVTLDVVPRYRRQRVAGELMRDVERRVVAAGGREMMLHVYAANDTAIRFYERLGYERVGVEAGFYGVGMDAFVYGKELAA